MEDLICSIDMVRDALFVGEEAEAFERIIERLEGFEIAYNVILNSNERLEQENKKLKDTVDKLKWRL